MTENVIFPEGFVGCLDGIDSLVLRGWLINVFAPTSPIPIQVRSGSEVVYRGATGHRRRDLEQMNPTHRVAGLVIDLHDLDLRRVTGSSLEIWAENNLGAPLFKAFQFALPSGFLEQVDRNARRCSDERKFSANTVFAEDIRYMLDTFAIRDASANALMAQYEHRPAPLWPAAASELYVDLSARSLITGDCLIDILKKSPPADITEFFERVTTTSSQKGFDNPYYLEKHPDVAQAVNPVLHFLVFGRHEGRLFRYHRLRSRGFDTSFFDAYFSSLLNAETSSSSVAAEHVLQVIRKSLQGAAFYGDHEIDAEDNFFAFLSGFQQGVLDVEQDIFEASTRYITETYLSSSDADYAPIPAEVADYVNARRQFAQVAKVASPQRGGVSIVTCYYKHREYFSQAALSVAATIAVTKRVMPWIQVEWIIVNDDPTTSSDVLLELVPSEIRSITEIFTNEENYGIVYSQNRAAKEARHEWILMLDCDDMLFPVAILVLDHYHRVAPARYYSSRCIDIGEGNEILRFRQRPFRQVDEITSGLHAGHLKFIHRSVFEDVGEFPPFAEGCQDYWLALEVAMREKIAYLPEYLYYYRWHGQTQSAANAASQAATTRRVKKFVLQGEGNYNSPALRKEFPRPRRLLLHGVVIRTVGNRILELKEAILSCSALCELRVTAVVVVHGDEEVVAFVRDQLADIACNNYTILPAYDGVSKRGYPLNVGVSYLLEIGADAISILDDDDILLPPMFISAQMIVDLARLDPQTSYMSLGRTLLKDKEDLIVQHRPRPVETIFSYNFITTNSVVLSRKAAENAVEEFGAIFPTDMHYLEDWVGFMRVIACGARIVYFDDFVGQYSGGSDGNVDFKTLPIEHQTCVAKAQFHASLLKGQWQRRHNDQVTPFHLFEQGV